MNPEIMKMHSKDIIEAFSIETGNDLETSQNIFYNSKVYELMQSELANYYCMSTGYLCEDLVNEYNNSLHK